MNCMFASYVILAALAPASLFAQGSNPPAGTRAPGRPVAATPAPPVAALAQGPAGPTTVIRPETIKTVYMTVTGRQGTTPLGKGKIRLVKYQFQLTSPRDLATGTPTGRLSLAPISITKAWDAASAPLLQAFDTNESLSVTFEFMTTIPDGREQPAFTIKLTNASVTMFSQSADAVGPGALEDVHFSYQKLDFQDNTNRVDVTISAGVVR